jgi:hypothetical protein
LLFFVVGDYFVVVGACCIFPKNKRGYPPHGAPLNSFLKSVEPIAGGISNDFTSGFGSSFFQLKSLFRARRDYGGKSSEVIIDWISSCHPHLVSSSFAPSLSIHIYNSLFKFSHYTLSAISRSNKWVVLFIIGWNGRSQTS